MDAARARDDDRRCHRRAARPGAPLAVVAVVAATMMMTMTTATTVEARERHRGTWSPRDVTCAGTERDGARLRVDDASTLFDDALGAVRDVVDPGTGTGETRE